MRKPLHSAVMVTVRKNLLKLWSEKHAKELKMLDLSGWQFQLAKRQRHWNFPPPNQSWHYPDLPTIAFNTFNTQTFILPGQKWTNLKCYRDFAANLESANHNLQCSTCTIWFHTKLCFVFTTYTNLIVFSGNLMRVQVVWQNSTQPEQVFCYYQVYIDLYI